MSEVPLYGLFLEYLPDLDAAIQVKVIFSG